MISNPKFTVIIPIYNAEKYLAETIESVLQQSIGFIDNIHIVLVNDGSVDLSEEICKRYTNMFPENIEYIYQENQGVAVARNTGLNLIRGKYVNLLDADDLWTTDAFEKIYDFFENEFDEVDAIACRVRQFGKNDRYHLLDYKFSKDRIVDITKEYNSIQLFLNSVFFKSDALEDVRFHINSKIAQDIPFINEVILKKERYGILKSVEYLYRKNEEGTSSIDNGKKKQDFYIKVLEDVYPFLFKLSQEKYGEIIPYIQYLVAYDVQWKLRIQGKYPECMDERLQRRFVELMKDTYKNINNKYILEQQSIGIVHRAYALYFKDPDNYPVDLVKPELRLKINEISPVAEYRIILKGRGFTEYLADKYELIITSNAGYERIIEEKPDGTYNYIGIDGDVVFNGRSFELELPEKPGIYYFFLRNKQTGIVEKMKIFYDESIDTKNREEMQTRVNIIKFRTTNIRIDKKNIIERLRTLI